MKKVIDTVYIIVCIKSFNCCRNEAYSKFDRFVINFYNKYYFSTVNTFHVYLDECFATSHFSNYNPSIKRCGRVLGH